MTHSELTLKSYLLGYLEKQDNYFEFNSFEKLNEIIFGNELIRDFNVVFKEEENYIGISSFESKEFQMSNYDNPSIVITICIWLIIQCY